MKKVLGLLLGLLGLFALATSSTFERNAKSKNLALERLKAGEGSAASPCILPPRTKRGLGFHSALRVVNFRSAAAPLIDQGLAEATKVPVPLWLSDLNQWRRMAGLHVVTENAHLSYGSEEHARYLVVQGPRDSGGFRIYDRSIGPGAHLENSRSPSYTAAGAEAAIGGPLAANVIQGADVAWEGRTESGDIDNLILAPFHRLSLLAPWAQIGGYGSFGEYPRRAAALALRGPLEAQPDGRAIEFPPANTNISINALSGSEWPNPIAACANYERPVGLPITVQIGRRLLLRSYSLRDQILEQVVDACGFDADSYRNPDARQQKRGRELLNAYGAVVLIPRKPLSPGHEYRVTLLTSQGSFDWDFALEDGASGDTAQAQLAAIRQAAATP